MYINIFRAHRQTRQALVLHGSSGYGKTEVVKQYAAEDNLKLVIIRGTYLDPLNMFIPHKKGATKVGLEVVSNGDVQTFADIPAEWIHELLTTTTPTLVFLDELGRPSSIHVFNMLMEAINEHTIHGRPISSMVQFIGATNFIEEDSGVINFNDAMWKRATHLIHAPDSNTVVENIGSELLKNVMIKFPDIIPSAKADVKFPLNSCPRQVSALGKLYETQMLTPEEFKKCCIGKIGLEDGTILFNRIQQYVDEEETKLPPVLESETDLVTLYDFEKAGNVGELYQYLQTQKNQELVAKYLVFLAGPELCKSMQLAKQKDGSGWDYNFKINNNSKNGPTLAGKTIKEVFFSDTPGENNFEGTEYGKYYTVNKYDFPNAELVFEGDNVSTILLLKLVQKIMDYSVAEAPSELRRAKMTKYQDFNQVKEQLLKKEEEGGEFFYEELRKEISEKLRNELANSVVVTEKAPTKRKKRA